MSDTVASKVIAAIAKAKRIPAETVTLDSRLEELKMDSLDGLNLFFDLEELFDVSISDEEARKMRTVGEIVRGLEHLVSAKNAADAPSSARN